MVIGISGTSASSIMVRSKWGSWGTYEHGIFNCPYYVAPMGSITESRIKICRQINHSSKTYYQYNTLQHRAVANCCGRETYEAHSFSYISGHYQCTLCGYTALINKGETGDNNE